MERLEPTEGRARRSATQGARPELDQPRAGPAPGLPRLGTTSVGCRPPRADSYIRSCRDALAGSGRAGSPLSLLVLGDTVPLEPCPPKFSSLSTDHAEADSEEAAGQDSKLSLHEAPLPLPSPERGWFAPGGCPCLVRGRPHGCQEPAGPAGLCAEAPSPFSVTR